MISQLVTKFTIYLRKIILEFPLAAKVAKWLLSAPWVIENPVYKYIYARKIAFDMEAGGQFPQVVQIELTNLCNADCIMCPRRLMTRPKGVMSFELFKKIIDECAQYNPDIILTGYGETLLDKGFLAKLAYIRKVFSGTVYFFTNGSLLNDEIATALIENKIDTVSISLDSAQPEEHAKIRRNLSLEEIISNIDNLVEKKKELQSSYPQVRVTMIRMEENKDSSDYFGKYFQDKVDAVYFQSLKNWGGTLEATKSDFHLNLDYSKRIPCHYLWKNMVLLWNGDVVLCCQDFNGKVILGNAENSSLKEIWDGEELASCRIAHQTKEFDKISICSDCSFHTVWW